MAASQLKVVFHGSQWLHPAASRVMPTDYWSSLLLGTATPMHPVALWGEPVQWAFFWSVLLLDTSTM